MENYVVTEDQVFLNRAPAQAARLTRGVRFNENGTAELLPGAVSDDGGEPTFTGYRFNATAACRATGASGPPR
ncbi:hypothetical protein Are01nite_23910 [Actinoplanes regularis]|nr:hypothetical protein Are01nite_23910 [Actinoplanes regularis]